MTRYEKTKQEVVEAAKFWWKGNRPVGWTKKQHSHNPLVNIASDYEKPLALAVSKL